MEPHNIYSHKMAINTHFIHYNCLILTFKRKKSIKKYEKKNRKKITFHIFSKCHFLSNGEGVSGQQAISGHPSQPTLNYRKNKKKKK